MMDRPEDLFRMQAEALQASNAALAKAMVGMQKLADLNMKTVQSSMQQSAEQVQALLGARDPQSLAKLMAGMAQQGANPLNAYAEAAYAISRESAAELASMLEQQMQATRRQLRDALEALAGSAPAGSEPAFDLLRKALAAADQAYEQSSAAARQLMAMAEAGMETASGGAGGKAGARKR